MTGIMAALTVAGLVIGYILGGIHGHSAGVEDGRAIERHERRLLGCCGVCGEGEGQ